MLTTLPPPNSPIAPLCPLPFDAHAHVDNAPQSSNARELMTDAHCFYSFSLQGKTCTRTRMSPLSSSRQIAARHSCIWSTGSISCWAQAEHTRPVRLEDVAEKKRRIRGDDYPCALSVVVLVALPWPRRREKAAFTSAWCCACPFLFSCGGPFKTEAGVVLRG